MSFTVADVLMAARDMNPAFTPTRHPDAVCRRWLTRYAKTLIGKIAGVRPSALSATVTTVSLSSYVFASGTVVPDAVQVPKIDTPDQAADWYYLSRNTRQLAFASPRPVEQLLVRVRFDAAGNVVAIDRTGVETVANISPESDKTPTLGRDRSFFEELFGNIGTVGAAGAGGAPGGGGGGR